MLTFAPDGALFRPASCDVDEVDGVSVVTSNTTTAVGDCISFKEARSEFFPLVSFEMPAKCVLMPQGLMVDYKLMAYPVCEILAL